MVHHDEGRPIYGVYSRLHCNVVGCRVYLQGSHVETLRVINCECRLDGQVRGHAVLIADTYY